MVCVPFGASVPLQPPDAVQVSASVELHVSNEVPPRATAPGDAVSDTAGRGLTVTAALTGALVPPDRAQVSTRLARPVNGPVLGMPLVGKVPLQPPDAVHDVALLEVHVSVEDPPAAIVAGDAVSETVGTGGGGAPAPPPHADNVMPMIRRQYEERTSSQTRFFSV